MIRSTPSLALCLLASTALYGVAPRAAHAQEATSATSTLAPVNVDERRQDEPFRTPAATSSVSAEEARRQGFDVRRMLDLVPGVAFTGPGGNSGVQVNIRGMQGFGRVGTSIDGVRQNFRMAGHGGGDFAYVDPLFLSGVDVSRGAVTTAGGMGALAGAVNFRTATIDDLVAPGEKFGGRLTAMTGTNGYSWSSGILGGMRVNDRVGVMLGISGLDSRNYENGKGQEIANSWEERLSGLARVSFAPNAEHNITLTGRVQTHDFSSNSYDQSVQTNLAQVQYDYRPNDPWVNLHVNAYFNEGRTKFNDKNYGGGGLGSNSGRRVSLDTIGVDVTNTSRFGLGFADVTWEYGVQYLNDEVTTREGGVNPEGERTMMGAYSQATLTRGIFDFIVGLRYDYYELSGIANAPPTPSPVPAVGLLDVDRSEGRFSPKFTAAVRPLDWLQVYASYAWTFRPPSTGEALYAGAHGANASSFYPNPYLKAERGQGWEIGTNILQRGLFTGSDVFRLKATYFQTDVEDFINMRTVRDANGGNAKSFYDNVPGTSTLSGFELEAGYDIGVAYANVSMTFTDVDYADGASQTSLPDSNVTLDAGVRLLDRRLNLGGRARFVGRTTQETTGGATQTRIQSHTLVDLYGSWAVMDQVDLFANATNVGDTSFTPALADSLDTGRGRTVIGGVRLTF